MFATVEQLHQSLCETELLNARRQPILSSLNGTNAVGRVGAPDSYQHQGWVPCHLWEGDPAIFPKKAIRVFSPLLIVYSFVELKPLGLAAIPGQGVVRGRTYTQNIARASPKHIATPKKLLIKNAFIFKICAICLQNRAPSGGYIQLLKINRNLHEKLEFCAT